MRGESGIFLAEMPVATGWTGEPGSLIGAAHQFLELVPAGIALVFVDRHDVCDLIQL
jgi:hypothetical protein